MNALDRTGREDSRTHLLLVAMGSTPTWIGGIEKALIDELGFQVTRCHLSNTNVVTTVGEVLDTVDRCGASVILLCVNPQAPEESVEVVRDLANRGQTPAVAAVTPCSAGLAGYFLRSGASMFLSPPFDWEQLRPFQYQARSLPSHNLADLRQKLAARGFVGASDVFLDLLTTLPTVADCDASALVSGETGTGKELCARAIHYLGHRAKHPFVPVNCGAIPFELFENEMFGHEAGAFTGAVASSIGLVEEAEGGTLFLDEVDSLPLLAQVKLLRFLQEKEFRRLGSRKSCRADVRIISAVNVDIEQKVRDGTFRSDLYYRLNAFSLSLPPLRERGGDVALLAAHFIRKYADQYGRTPLELGASALGRLLAYGWPGNVRELENVMLRSMLLTPGPVLEAAHLILPQGEKTGGMRSFQELKITVVSQFEKRFITELLIAFDGNITKAAKAARKNRRAFWELMRKHGIQTAQVRNDASDIGRRETASQVQPA